MLARRLARFSSQTLSRSSTPGAATIPAQQQPRALISSTAHRGAATSHDEHHGDGHDSHYDPPGGWLWGERPGEKYEKEGWEGLYYWGFCGSLVIAGIAYTMKEDTSIQTWALEEARRRLEKEGILEDTNGK